MLDTVLVAICDAYWNQTHRRGFVKLDDDTRRTIAGKVGKWSKKRLGSGVLAAVVDRLDRQGLVIAKIYVERTVHAKTVETVASVQPSQLGIDRAAELRVLAKKKR